MLGEGPCLTQQDLQATPFLKELVPLIGKRRKAVTGPGSSHSLLEGLYLITYICQGLFVSKHIQNIFLGKILLSRLVAVAFGGWGLVHPLEEMILFLVAMLSAGAWWRCREVMSKVYL